MKNVIQNESRPLFGNEKLPVAKINSDFEILEGNRAAKEHSIFSDGVLKISATDKAIVKERLAVDGYVSLRLLFFPYSGSVLNFIDQDDCITVFLVVEELQSKGSTVSADGVEATSSALRNDLQKTFINILSLENEIGDNIEASEHLDKVKRSCYKMLRTVQDIGAISRFESENFDPYLRVTDIAELISSLCKSIENIGIGRRDIPFSWSVPKKQILARVDTALLEQAIIQILLNAFKYTRDNNRIHLEMKEEDNLVSIIIKDKGAGIQANNLDKIKNPYFSVDPADDGGDRPGIGIGLSIAEYAVHAFDGTMVICSEFGEGTSVALTIPVITDLRDGDVFASPRGSYVVDRFSPLYIGFCEICILP